MPLLDWLNKDQAVKQANQVPYRLLQPVAELSYGDANNENMLIQGDNLDALKALLPLYAGKVKCIYVDPPFNTEQAFEHYDDNLEHSVWLSTMYPRFEILRALLSEEGTMFVHIDDNQLGYLTVILDELFGRKNRTHIVAFKQGSATGHKAINPGMANTCNFILSYAKDKNRWKPNKVFTERGRDSRYSQFIININESHEDWELMPIAEAFAFHLGVAKRELKKKLGVSYEDEITKFVVENAARVIRTARPDYKNVGEDVRVAIDKSKSIPEKVLLHSRRNAPDMYFKNGERWIFYKDKLKLVNGELVTGEPLTTLWADILSNNLHNEGGVSFPKSKKPEALIKRVIELSTNENDFVLDSFLGSGTTAAVAHKMNRRYIGIEMGEHAETHCQPRLQKVVDGEQGGISKSVEWQGGGGFHYYRLGEPIFDEYGCIRGDIRFAELAAHVWYMETRTPLLKKRRSPLLGVHNGVAYYLLYNGILGDRKPQGGNVLTGPILSELPKHDGPKVIFGETSRLGEARLKDEQITFKQIPYDVRAR